METKVAIDKSVKNELLIGCGNSRGKQIPCGGTKEWSNLVTLDFNASHTPDVVWDLNNIPLPFEDNSFDEIHAYEVLEHVGRQGDYKFFFGQFSDFWRILKPNGLFVGTCPLRTSVWAFGDPSHTRVIQKENLYFLDQSIYDEGANIKTMTDFKDVYQADFKVEQAVDLPDQERLAFILQAVKPSRISI